MAKAHQRQNPPIRQLVFVAHDWRYTRKGRPGDPCTYCGVVSDTMDHVPPLHYVARMVEVGDHDFDARTVPACRECNAILGGKLLLTIQSRRAHIKDAIRRRYKAQLRMPGWDADDMEGMSAEMARDIAANLRLREWVMERLAWRR